MLSAVLSLLTLGSLAHCAAITWTNTSGGNWSVAANWNPNQVPTNADTALITTPGTYAVVLDFTTAGNQSLYPTITVGAGGGAAGVQTLAMTNKQFFFTNLLVTTGGAFAANGCYIGSPGETMTMNGGVLNSAGSSFGNTLVVTNGAVVNSTNSGYTIVTVANGVFNSAADTFSTSGLLGVVSALTVASGGIFNEFKMAINLGSSLIVAAGGVVNGVDYSAAVAVLNGGLTNSGTINFTNAQILVGYGTGTGGIVNQPGGVINLRGAAAIVSSGFVAGDFSYIINQGSISETAGSGSTLNVAIFDNTQGTITNLSGTMVLETYRTNLSGIYYSGSGAIIQFHAVNDGINYVTPGTPLVMSGAGQFQFVSGYLKYLTNSVPNLDLKANVLVLGPAFQGGAITNLALDGIFLTNTLPVTGTFAVTNSALYGSFTVASGGVFAMSNSYLHGSVAVAGGGRYSANGSGADVVAVASGGVFNANGSVVRAMTVAASGTANVTGPFSLEGPLTNSGTINISNSAIVVYNSGINNQAGGLISIFGGGSSILYFSGPQYFINRGTVLQNSPSGTNTINILGFDTSQGTVTNLAGTLVLETFQTNLAGTFNTAAGATIQFAGGTAATPLMPGAPLLLSGSGQFQFISGFLSLPANVVPNLGLQGGTLELGPAFQGGVITNLAVGGMTVTNTFPVKGTFTATNQSTLYGNFAVTNGGVFNFGGTENGAVTVANGGLMTVVGSGVINSGGSLTLANGATLNITGAFFNLYGPLTNAGTFNVLNPPGSFNSGMALYNDGSANYRGGVINQASGLINFGSDNTIIFSQNGGFEYLVNQGRITKSAGTNYSQLTVTFTTNSGAIATQSGQIVMSPFVTQSGGSLNVVLDSANNYGTFVINYNKFAPNVSSNIVLAGAFNATLNNGYVPTNGTVFNLLLLYSASYSGNFSSLGLPSAVTWQSTYGSTNFTLVAGSGSPQFGTFNLSGTNLFFNGTGGSPGSNYVVLVTTNLTIPLTNWLALITNTFDGSGQFRYTNNVSPVKPRQFFIFKLP